MLEEEGTKHLLGQAVQTCILQVDKSVPASETQIQTWGMPWSPDEFVDMAIKAGHPSTFQSFLPGRLDDSIKKMASMSSHQRVSFRAQALKFWVKRSLQLRESEKTFGESLEPTVAEVLSGKKILLWKEMLDAIQYEDMGVTGILSWHTAHWADGDHW